MRTLEERNRLVEQHLPLVKHIVGRMKNGWAVLKLGIHEALQVGNLSLIKAAANYDKAKGKSFMAHAWANIVRDINRAANADNVIRVPEGPYWASHAKPGFTEKLREKADKAQAAFSFGTDTDDVLPRASESGYKKADDEDEISYLMGAVTESEEHVLRQIYQYDKGSGDVAREMGISRQWVEALRKRALKKIKDGQGQMAGTGA